MTKTEAFTKLRDLAGLEGDEPFDLHEGLLRAVITELDDAYTYGDDASWLLYMQHDLTELTDRLTALVAKLKEADAD